MRRYLPWIIGAVLLLTYFAVFETLAFTRPATHASLSNFVSSIARDWPMSIFVCGFVCGGAAVHFFWPWRDNPLGKGGG